MEGKSGKKRNTRIFAKHSRRNGFLNAAGLQAGDDWTMSSGGFRMDWIGSGRNSLTLQGDLHAGDIGQEGLPTLFQNVKIGLPDYRTHVKAANVIGRVKPRFSETADMDLRVSIDRMERRDDVMIGGEYSIARCRFAHHFEPGSIHEVVWGLGYRLTADRIQTDLMATMVPDHKRYDVLSAFIQDEMRLVPDRLRLTIGSKFEHNDFTGGEVQPNLRFLWTINDRHSVWGAVSRALRVPDRSDFGLRVDYNLDPIRFVLLGNPKLRSEEVLAWESGYRLHPAEKYLVQFERILQSIPAHHDLQHRRHPRPDRSDLDRASVFSDNRMSGTGSGLEASGDWEIRDGLRLHGSYVFSTCASNPTGTCRPRTTSFRRTWAWMQASSIHG